MSFNDRIQQLRSEDVEHTKRRICYWGCSQDWANVPDCPESRTIRGLLAGHRPDEKTILAAWAWLKGGAKVPAVEQVGGAA